MNKQNFKLNNGYPLNQASLDRMQEAYSVFNALGAIVGEKSIISGCVMAGSNVSDGVVFVNGEVFEFKGGSLQTKVVIKEDVTNLVYKNNNSYPAVKTRYVTFGTGVGAMDWVDFKRPIETKGIAALLLEINTALDAVVSKLQTIDENAKVQVQADWDQTDQAQKSFIKNKPGIINYLAKGSFAIGDVTSADNIRTVTFPDIGTNNYMVVGCMVSASSNFDTDNDVIWMVREKNNASFKITLREVSGVVQNLTFEYLLIPQ